MTRREARIRLHERPHDRARLARHGLTELHLPVADFTPPSPAQLDRGAAAIAEAIAAGERVAVHCGAGKGRTGTLLACYLVYQGLAADAAIARVRAVRPGSVETRASRGRESLPGSVWAPYLSQRGDIG